MVREELVPGTQIINGSSSKTRYTCFITEHRVGNWGHRVVYIHVVICGGCKTNQTINLCCNFRFYDYSTGRHTITPVPVTHPMGMRIHGSHGFNMNWYTSTANQCIIKPCAYFTGYTLNWSRYRNTNSMYNVRVPDRFPNQPGIWPSSSLQVDVIKLNIFHVTGPLCGEFTGHRRIPRTKVSDAELWYFIWYVSE